MESLNRGAAPFDSGLWERIDEAAEQAARAVLTGRRFIEVEGPYGLGLTSIEIGNDDYCRQPSPDEAGAVISAAISVPMVRRIFNLSLRRLAGHLDNHQPLDLNPVEQAAEAVARREEELIYYGQEDFHLAGLLTAKGRSHLEGGDWTRIDQALQDVLAAVTRLDDSGFAGPYALVLSPRLYNGLFRRYENTDLLQVEHLGRLCTAGIFKAPIEGGAVIDPRVGKLMIGQDISTGFASQDGIHCQLYVVESVVLRLDDAKAVCTIATAPQEPVRAG